MIGGLFTVAAIVMLVSTAGGGGWLVAGGPLQGHAEAPATVNPDTAAEHGFAEPTVEEVEIQETITAGGVEKRVNVTGYVAATGTQDGAVQVLLLTLPGWDVAGVTANPLAYVPLKQAVRHVLPQLPMETPEVTWEGESSMELGGQTVTAGEYAVEGQEMQLVVARRTIEGDPVFAVGAYDADQPDSRDRIEALFAEVTTTEQ